MKTLFITGIGTEVGKTIASAIVVEALQADYFKPVQAGDLDNSDTDKVRNLVSNSSLFHANAYALNTPMSPHAAAAIDDVNIDIQQIKRPRTDKHLVIEGAGGLLVPLNDKQTILDLILPEDKVIVVSKHYLGSINHTLLTLQLLHSKGFDCALIFNGEEHPSTESIIKKMTNVNYLGRINQETLIDKNCIKKYAAQFTPKLKQFINS